MVAHESSASRDKYLHDNLLFYWQQKKQDEEKGTVF